jgi:hypothetical protein
MTVLPFEHADEAAAALREVVADQGPGVLSDPLMLGSLLSDLLPGAPSAVRILVAAAEDHVADAISDNVSRGIDADAAVKLAASSFARTSLSAPEVSQWVAVTFAEASGHQVTSSWQSTPSGLQAGGQANISNPGAASGPQVLAPTAPGWPVPGQSAPTMQPGVSPASPSGFRPGGQPGQVISPGMGQVAGPGFQPGIPPRTPPPFVSPGRPSGPAPFAYAPYQPASQRPTGAAKQQFAPAPVLSAVKLMYGGIALSGLLAIIDFVVVGSLGSTLYLTSHQQNMQGASSLGAIMSLFGVGFWILLAWANKRGMPWARIVAPILLVIFTLYTLISIAFVNPLAIVVELGTIAVGVIALVQLWRRESSPYYQLR